MVYAPSARSSSTATVTVSPSTVGSPTVRLVRSSPVVTATEAKFGLISSLNVSETRPGEVSRVAPSCGSTETRTECAAATGARTVAGAAAPTIMVTASAVEASRVRIAVTG